MGSIGQVPMQWGEAEMTANATPVAIGVVARNIRFDLSGAENRHWFGGDSVDRAGFAV
jgi:hypothetical protein